jgi:putative SOS response-associated peptidase YedK
MPAILAPASYDRWLTPGELTADAVLPLLKPYDATQMKATPVSTKVNSSAVDAPELVLPLAI